MFMKCEKCGKNLIERLPNGLLRFCFGKPSPDDKTCVSPADYIVPVEIMIHGSIKMKCLRKSCRLRDPDHWNIMNFFPSVKSTSEDVVPIDVESSGINENLK